MRIVSLAATLLLLALVLTPVVQTGLAQNSTTCPQLVTEAISELGTNCANLGPNSVCYGFSRVETTFAAEGVSLGAPGDSAPLAALQRIRTSALNSSRGEWGIAVMKVQANIPGGLSDQAVYLLLGDVVVESAVAPEDALIPVAPVTIAAAKPIDLRSAPGLSAPVIGSFPSGSPLVADGVSPDGRWLRVLHLNGSAWALRDALDPEVDVSGLPTITAKSRTPMQAFRFTTGTGNPECADAPPSTLVIQGPQNLPVDVVANGVNIRISSTIFLRTLSGNVMQIITGNGAATLYPDTPDEVVIPPAFSVTLPLDATGNATDAWIQWQLLSQQAIDLFAPLADIPTNVWNYAYIPPTIIQPSGIGQPTPTVIPTSRPPKPPRPPFPSIPMLPGETGVALPRGTWQAVTVGGPTCPPWLFYHSDRDGGWNVYRLGNARLGNTANNNVSQGGTSANIQPSISVDGQWVAFTSNRDARGGWEIWVGKADGSFQQRVTYNTAIDINPQWGPAGLIAFESNRDANWELYMVDVSGSGEPTRLTDDPANDINPFWSADGEHIVFQSDRDGDWEIYMLDVATGDVTPLTDNDTEDQEPILSHDDTMMAWVQMNGFGVYDLWLMDLETGETRQLADAGVSVGGPRFAPDDTFIAYHANVDGDFDVFAVDVETGQIKNATNNVGVEDRAPTFWCDSSIVVFHSDRIASREKPGQREIYEVNPLPIGGPATDAVRLTSNTLADDIYPLGDPRDENNSREGRVPAHP